MADHDAAVSTSDDAGFTSHAATDPNNRALRRQLGSVPCPLYTEGLIRGLCGTPPNPLSCTEPTSTSPLRFIVLLASTIVSGPSICYVLTGYDAEEN